MIYSAVLVNSATKSEIVSSNYWSYKVSKRQLTKYLKKLLQKIKHSERLQYEPIIIDDFKFYSREVGKDLLIVFVMDLDEPDDEAKKKINGASRVLRNIIEKESKKYIRDRFWELMDPYILSRFVISLIGESGVGKTSLLCLLIGHEPPEEHQPTIALNTEVMENIRFANYEIMILDFAGQEASRKFWDFSNTDMIFLLTDSTLKNLISSKGILSKIQKDHPDLPIIIFANKQDLPNALDPSAISKIMGVDARSMVAVDLAYRNQLLDTLVCVLCEHFHLDIPDVLPDDLLRFVPG
jgi:ADP-ribosylation factor-like protein 1